jgi:CheY-like chemotaxis protein
MKPLRSTLGTVFGAIGRLFDALTGSGRVPARKILIVDDDAPSREATVAKLGSAGHTVLVATDGSEAIALVGKHQFDFVLMDMHLPPDPAQAWDGIRLVTWLRGLENARRTRFIILSEDDAAVLKRHPMAGCASAFIQKPIDHRRLRELLAEPGPALTPRQPGYAQQPGLGCA